MQVIYRWAFAVAPASPCPSTLKNGGARAPTGYMAPAHLHLASEYVNNYATCLPGSY